MLVETATLELKFERRFGVAIGISEIPKEYKIENKLTFGLEILVGCLVIRFYLNKDIYKQ